jgi:hypothetical protein
LICGASRGADASRLTGAVSRVGRERVCGGEAGGADAGVSRGAGGSATDADALMAPSVIWSALLEGDADGLPGAGGSDTYTGALLLLAFFLPLPLAWGFAIVSASVSWCAGYVIEISFDRAKEGRGEYLFNDSWLRFFSRRFGRGLCLFLARRLFYFPQKIRTGLPSG